jgi:hypothetical protein
MFEAIEIAFPRLIAALRRYCGLTHMQAVGVIYARRYGDNWGGRWIDQAGGADALIRQAMRQRNYRRYRLAA